MASLDFFGIKERIVAILKNDTTNIFSSTPTDKSKFRAIVAGAPDKHDLNNGPYPKMWVTNDRLMAVVRDAAVYSSNSTNGREYDLRIKIVLAVEKKDSEKAEEQIDDFLKVIIEKLESDIDLRTIGGAESTQLADEAKVTEIRDLEPELKGDGIRGRTIIFKILATA